MDDIVAIGSLFNYHEAGKTGNKASTDLRQVALGCR